MPHMIPYSKDGQGHKETTTSREIFSQEMLIRNIKALALTFQKLLSSLEFSNIGLNTRSMTQDKHL